MLQDGFQRVYAADTINIERVEVLRGPSALLYGTGNFGGVVNYITKKGQFDAEAYHVGVMVGSHSLYRLEADANLPLVDEDSPLAKYEPALRLTGAWEQNEDYTQYYNQEHWQVNGVLTFKPFKNTKVNVFAEMGQKSEYGVGFQNVRNSYGGTSANRAVLWLTDTFDEDTGVKTGETEDNRTFRWSGDDTYLKGPYRNIGIDIEQRITDDLHLKIGYTSSKTVFDSRQINAWVTSGGGLSEGSGYMSQWTGEEIADRTGDLWSHMCTSSFGDVEAGETPDAIDNAVIQYEWVDDNQETNRDQIRIELAYTKDTGAWGKHSVVLGFSYDATDSTEDVYRPGQTYVMSYEDEDGVIHNGETYVVNNYDRYSYKNIEDHTAFEYGTQGDGYEDNPQVHWTSTRSKTWDTAFYAMYQGQFFNDRLTLVGGARYDRVDATSTTDYVWANELYEAGETSMGKARTYSGRTGDSATTATSPQVGVSYQLTDNLNVFAVYSTGIVPNFDYHDGNDEMLDPSDVKNYEVGIKFYFFEGKLSGTLSGFYIEREITSTTYKLSKTLMYVPVVEWLKSDYAAGTLDPSLTAEDVYDDVTDASTYHGVIPDTGQSGDDSPENTFSAWARYELSHASDALDGWAIGSGVTWEDERCWFTGFMGDGNSTYVAGTKVLVQYWTDPRYTVNFMVEYKTTLFDDYNARFAVNIDNLLDDKDLYGLVYAPGRSVKFSFSLDF